MVFKCSAPGCKMGYTSSVKDARVTFHRFPMRDPNMLDIWISAIPRDCTKWRPTASSRLCSRHFVEDDFVLKSRDTSRDVGKTLKFRRLADDAVPSKWPGYDPQCSGKGTRKNKPRRAPVKSRKSLSDQSPQVFQRLEVDSDEELRLLSEDVVSSDRELYKKLYKHTLPEGFSLLRYPKVTLAKISTSNNNGMDIFASLEVEKDLSFRIYHRHTRIENLSAAYCLSSISKIRSVSEVINILAFLISKDQILEEEICGDNA
uniref:THAP domain-containing protein 4 n=1 Tax=Caligus clemensi TaxID=344056 RepID=C1C0R4_CALCM|nr:THAP domain-containing protein 4 [Caligus clemensi]